MSRVTIMEGYETWLGARLRGLGFAEPSEGPTGDDVDDVVARVVAGNITRCEATGVAAFVNEVRLCAAGDVGTVAVIRGRELGGVDAMALAVQSSAVVGNAVWLGGAVANRNERVWGQSFSPGLAVDSAVFVVARPAKTVACDTTPGCVQVGGTCSFMAAFNVVIKNKTMLNHLGVVFPPEVAAYLDALAACAVVDEVMVLRNMGQRCPRPPEALKTIWAQRATSEDDIKNNTKRVGIIFRSVTNALQHPTQGPAAAVLHRALIIVSDKLDASLGAYELWPPGPHSVFEDAVKRGTAEIRVGGLTLDADVILDGIGMSVSSENRDKAVSELMKAFNLLFVDKEFGVGVISLRSINEPIYALMSTSNAIVTPFYRAVTKPKERPQVWMYPATIPVTPTNNEFRQALKTVTTPNNGTVVIGGVLEIPGHAVTWSVCPNGNVQIWDSNYRRFARDSGTGIDELAETYNVVEEYGQKIYGVVVVAVTPAAAFIDAVVQPRDEYTGVPQPLNSESIEAVTKSVRELHRNTYSVFFEVKNWFESHNMAPIIPEDQLASAIGVDGYRDFIALAARDWLRIRGSSPPATQVLQVVKAMIINNHALKAVVDRRVESNNVGLRVFQMEDKTSVDVYIGSRTWSVYSSKPVEGNGVVQLLWNMMSAKINITEKGLELDSQVDHAARAFAYIFVNYGNPFRKGVTISRYDVHELVEAYERLAKLSDARAFLKARPPAAAASRAD